MPDIIFGNTLIEFKCYTAFATARALGHGSQRCGGAPSTADGHFIAFGNTEEHLRKMTLGLAQRGTPDQPPFSRVTGTGYVAAVDGHYADALRKHRNVILFVTETLGGISARGIQFLHYLSQLAATEGHRDGTVYGTARTSTTSFFIHHLSAISRAIVTADALTLTKAAAAEDFLLTTSLIRSAA